MKSKTCTKVYLYVGSVLLGIAAAIVGFLVGGVYLAIPGFFIGILAGHFYGKHFSPPPYK